MNEDKFIEILMKNDPESMMKFLLENGKKAKPVNPIYFTEQKESEE